MGSSEPRSLASLLSTPANSYIRRMPSFPQTGVAAEPPTRSSVRARRVKHRPQKSIERVSPSTPPSPAASSSGSARSSHDEDDSSITPNPSAPSPPAASSSSHPLASSAALPSCSCSHAPSVYWDHDAFSLSLSFASARSHGPPVFPEESAAPPAFFPLQRIAFSPRLRIRSPSGLPLSSIGGMSLGITGVLSIPHLDRRTGAPVRDLRSGTQKLKCQRVVVDFVTDLTPGIDIWRRDAEAIRAAGGHEGVLPMGNYMLPLSMRIPASDKLPPSFTCPYFSITYTISLALHSSALHPATRQPLFCKVFSVPFDVLPATLPSPSPELPRLVWQGRKSTTPSSASTVGAGMWEGLKRAVSMARVVPVDTSSIAPPPPMRSSLRRAASDAFRPATPCNSSSPATTFAYRSPPSRPQTPSRASAPKIPSVCEATNLPGFRQPAEPEWTHIVCPSLPSGSAFSPGAQAHIPISLQFITRGPSMDQMDTSAAKVDLYVRVALVRTVFVRERGLDLKEEAEDMMLPPEVVRQGYIIEEKEIVSRWVYLPHSSLTADDDERSGRPTFKTMDVDLPLFSPSSPSSGWAHGYSTSLLLIPEQSPQTGFNSSTSWFSPALRHRPPIPREYARHAEVENRFVVTLDVGFAARSASTSGCDEDSISMYSPLAAALEQIRGALGPAIVSPSKLGEFSAASTPKICRRSGFDLTNPFPSFSSSVRTRTGQELPPFPGKVRTIRFPVTIGSVAEPMLGCLSPTTPLPMPLPRMRTREWGDDETNGAESSDGVVPTGEAERGGSGRGPGEQTQASSRDQGDEGTVAGIDAEAWVMPPPDYTAALTAAPAYC